MAYAPNYDSPVAGLFRHRETDATFEYAEVKDGNGQWFSDYTHKIFMTDGSVRYATVMKTVAHVAVDEDECGNTVVERWPIKQHRVY